MPEKPKPKYAWVRGLSDAINLATTAAASVGICLFVGWWLDRRFETEPVFVAIGALAGVATAIKVMWDKMMRQNKRQLVEKKAAQEKSDENN